MVKPLSHSVTQKTFGSVPCPIVWFISRGCQPVPFQITAQAARNLILAMYWRERLPIVSRGFANPRSGYPFPPSSVKQLVRAKGYTILHNVIRGPGQFMSYCRMSCHPIGSLQFPIVVSLNFRTISPGQFRCLRERPGQILVPVLRVTLALGLPLARPSAGDFPAIGTVVAHLGKAPDVSCLEHYGKSQDTAHTRDGGQVLIAFLKPDLPLNKLFDLFNLSSQANRGVSSRFSTYSKSQLSKRLKNEN